MIYPRKIKSHTSSNSPTDVCADKWTKTLRKQFQTWLAGATIRHRLPLLSTWALCLVLVVQTCALPIPLAFLLVSPDADVKTAGCSKKTCCTALCYLDKKGVHHCVHMHDESCENNLSRHEVDPLPIIYSTVGTLSPMEQLFPIFHLDSFISLTNILAESNQPIIPSPPPKY